MQKNMDAGNLKRSLLGIAVYGYLTYRSILRTLKLDRNDVIREKVKVE